MHFVICKAEETLVQTESFKRFIDDILFISIGKQTTDNIKTELLQVLNRYSYCSIFRKTDTGQQGNNIKFLDVLHKIELTVLPNVALTLSTS